MTTPFNSLTLAWSVAMLLMLSSCYVEDPGPRQETDREYSVVDFDRLEMGSGLRIKVDQGNYFSVSAHGDRRNINDLIVEKQGSTLLIRYRNNRERRHDTFIEITMPTLHAVTFSGGSDSRVSGFSDIEIFDVYLSGGSVCQLDVDANTVNVVLSGAAHLSLRGEGQILNADVSGASALKGFHFPVTTADLSFSGASDGQVVVSEVLEVVATGASHVVYRGNPTLSSDVSGASSVRHE